MSDLCSPSTYLHFPEKCNKLCLLCWLKLLKFSSWDKLISRKKCKHKKEILHFYPNLFISLTYILASASYEVKKKEKSGSATKKPKLTLLENLELLMYPALVRQGSLKVRMCVWISICIVIKLTNLLQQGSSQDQYENLVPNIVNNLTCIGLSIRRKAKRPIRI